MVFVQRKRPISASQIVWVLLLSFWLLAASFAPAEASGCESDSVSSTAITDVEWCPDDESDTSDSAYGTLTITFSSGAIYEYSDVQKYVYDEFIGDVSAGQYFNREIRGRYPCIRIGGPPRVRAPTSCD